MKDLKCAYCMKGELLAEFGLKICELPSSIVYLFKEQSHPGRLIVAYKEHVNEIVDLTEEERNAFFADINYAARVMHKVFHPQKINYGAYGDKGHHLHFHLVPKYADEFEWGGVFAMNPDCKYLSDAEYEMLIDQIRAAF